MTLQALPAPFSPVPMFDWPGTTSLSAQLLDAAGEKFAMVVTVPKSGDIDTVRFTTGTVTTWEDLEVRLETVGGDGLPTGTLYGGSAAATVTGVNTDDNVEKVATLPTPATAVRGDRIAVVIQFSSAIGNLNLRHHASTSTQHPFTALYTGSWTRNFAAPMLALGYDDGTYPQMLGCFPFTGTGALAAVSYNNATAIADEYGLTFTTPVKCRVAGFAIAMRSNAGGTFEVVLYDGTTVLEAVSYDGDELLATANERHLLGWFAADHEFAAGATFRITLKPTSADSLQLVRGTIGDAAVREAAFGLSNFSTRRLDGGAWDDSQTTLVPFIYPLISHLDDGAGGGGGGGHTLNRVRLGR